jgi:hypothetical protein
VVEPEAAAAVQVVVREMGMTRGDFFRTFPAVAPQASWQVSEDGVSLGNAHGQVVIQLGPQSRRRMGSLELPIICLRFEFSDHDPGEVAAFMRRFDLAFRRGGG